MNPNQPQQSDIPTDYNQPVAYDKDGNPLYAHPPAAAQVIPQVVQLTRAADPQMPHISDEAKRRHEESVAKYPALNLSEGEYIISAVRRHPIGLVSIIGVAVLLVVLVLAMIAAYPMLASQAPFALPSLASFVVPALLFIVLIALGGYIATYVYLGNRFYLTNESVIQEIQTSLFAHREQTVSLANIEDASYRQTGIVQSLFNYGSIRLSTEGDETTYRFHFVSDPKRQIAVLNNAVESFKNGRPVTND